MPITRWNTDLSVGVEKLDTDHQQLIATMNTVFDALLQGSSASTARKALLTLQEYVNDHFLREEKWMLKNAYVELDRHKQEHDALRQHVARLLELPQHSDDQLAVEMLVVLRDWLLGHIARSDRAAAH